MQRIPDTEPFFLSPVLIYWDSLQEIVERINNGREIEIESGKYKYDDLNELRTKTKKTYIDQIYIRGRDENELNNDIRVTIEPNRTYINYESGSTELAAKIKDLLSKSTPWYMASLDSPLWLMFTGILVAVPSMGAAFILLMVDGLNFFIKMAVALFGILPFTWYFFPYSPRLVKTRIYTSLKKDRLNFWERHKGEILVGLFIGLITALISFIFTILNGYLLDKINK